LTQQDLVVNRTENNLFTHVVLDTTVAVNNKFFIGYRQNTAADIGVGFDKSSDSADKLFAFLGAGWEPVNLHGNMMMRPVFGKAMRQIGSGVKQRIKTSKANQPRIFLVLSSGSSIADGGCGTPTKNPIMMV